MNTENTITSDIDDSIDLVFPVCGDDMKPYVGQFFNNLDEGYKFYAEYAAACGFQSRKSTVILADDGTIRTRYMLCNKEGVRGKPDELLMSKKNKTTLKRNRTSCKANCMARIVFQIYTGGRYRVIKFIEGHTHSMVPTVSRHLMVSNRNVDHLQQMFILSGIKANIGPMRTFRLFKEIVGSYEVVGCISNDFKNYVRDLRVFADGSDAHMLLNAFRNKQELSDGFKYFYDVDDENKLTRLIWTDEAAVQNYKMFGQAVSFDATYNTNRYKMIFTPFTGRDNHGKCMSFGAAIISREDMESYAWVLQKFVECMGQAPQVFVTDQDPGLKKAVALVWPKTSHRYCMWHITMKVAEKLPVRLRDDSEFKTNFGKIVWSDVDEPAVFDENWKNMIDEYDLSGNRWFSDMFDDRSSWIPAYFRDISMSGLFRTTSLSESENSYFKRFINKNADLVLLFINYSSALEAQRHMYQKLTLSDETGVPILLTKLNIERHASSIYTHSIFKEVQVEIESSLVGCVISNMDLSGVVNTYVVDDNLDGKFTVSHDCSNDYLLCSCRLFSRKGLLCRHMFAVLKVFKANKIPNKYVSQRWCKVSVVSPTDSRIQSTDSCLHNHLSGNKRLLKVISECISHVNGNEEMTEQLISELTDVSRRFAKIGNSDSSSNQKQSLFLQFYGSPPTDQPCVLPPDIVKTKGSGAGGRRKSNHEKALILSQKPMRNCRKCKTMGHHDSRNCPGKDTTNV